MHQVEKDKSTQTVFIEQTASTQTECKQVHVKESTTQPKETQEASSQTLADLRVNELEHKNSLLDGKLQRTKDALAIQKKEKAKLQRKVQQLNLSMKTLEESIENKEAKTRTHDSSDEDDWETIEEERNDDDDSNDDDADDDYMPDEDEDEDDDDDIKEPEEYHRIPLASDENLRKQPKYIVFLSHLLVLFQWCHICKTDEPSVEVFENGTEVIIKSVCSNPKCHQQSIWRSQPKMPNTKMRAGNFLICMAVLFAGSSITKVRTIFRHMGLACISINSFFRHQRTKLFPLIHLYWKSYQDRMMVKIKELNAVTLAGDGRHDSMGHCAKYCGYTIFCCSFPCIVHFTLIQRNEAGNSPAMEFMGFEQAMNYLLASGLVVNAFISDRHTQIAAHFKNVLTQITHYFDLWHLKKKIRKVLTKISKLKGNETLKEWIGPCENHLYWSATTTHSGDGQLIWAKFQSFLSHIINVHTGIPNELFNKCAHDDDIPHRRWLDKDDVVYDKISKALTKDSLKKGITQASPVAQTDCLEGFHSCLNQFAPKMIGYSYTGMYCRHILAVTHFNFNLRRDAKIDDKGEAKVTVTYPKFKNGQATVREVKVLPNFDYVEELYQMFLCLEKRQLKAAEEHLKATKPPPMNTMLEKEEKDLAIAKKRARDGMVSNDVPATGTVSVEVTPRETQRVQKQRCCTECQKPMKGHKNVTSCPRNQRRVYLTE